MDYQIRIEELEQEIANLKADIENEQSPFPIRTRYYYLMSDGTVHIKTWDNAKIDQQKLLIGNIFKNREEAEFMVEKLKVIAELKQYSVPFSLKQHKEQFFIAYNATDREIAYLNSFIKAPTLYFHGRDEVEHIVQAVGEDRIKKYYLEVEEE